MWIANTPYEISPSQQGIRLLKQGYEAAQKDDLQAYQKAMVELQRSQKHRTQLARAVGFRECSQQFPASTGASSPSAGG